jgi:hypothetical protein
MAEFSLVKVARFLKQELGLLREMHQSALQILMDTEAAADSAYLLCPIADSSPADLLEMAHTLVGAQLPPNRFLSRQSRARRARLYFACVREFGASLKRMRATAISTASKTDDVSGLVLLRFEWLQIMAIAYYRANEQWPRDGGAPSALATQLLA